MRAWPTLRILLPLIPSSCCAVQTTNLLLQCGDEALRTPPADIPALAPLK